MKKRPKPPRRNTPWRPALWERQYRGMAIWVEEIFTDGPKWNWCTEGGPEGRAVSRLAAMRAAMAAVDSPSGDAQ